MPMKNTTVPATSSSGRAAWWAQARVNPRRSLVARIPPPRFPRVATSTVEAAKVAASIRYSGRGSARRVRATPAAANPAPWPRVIAATASAFARPVWPPVASTGIVACRAGWTSASMAPSRYSTG